MAYQLANNRPVVPRHRHPRRETRERWEAEASKRDERAEAREATARRREEERKREEAALVSANLELQVLFSEIVTAPMRSGLRVISVQLGFRSCLALELHQLDS